MEHLLVHWFIITPAVRWITAPQRGWSKRFGVQLAVAVLVVMALIEIQRTKSNFYEILEVQRDDLSSINAIYRRKAVLLHPDRNPSANAAAEFIRLKQAHEVLTDTSKRKMYHKFGDYEEKIHPDHFPMIACFSMVSYVISFILGFMFTTAPEHKESRTTIYLYIVFSCAAEMYMRFIGFDLFTWIPILGAWLEFEKIAALRALYPCVLSGAMLISSSTHADGDEQMNFLLREVVTTNLSITDFLKAANYKAHRSGIKPVAPAADVPVSAAIKIHEMATQPKKLAKKSSADSPTETTSNASDQPAQQALPESQQWTMARIGRTISQWVFMVYFLKIIYDTIAARFF